MAAWKDVSSWSQSDSAEDRAVPKAWELVIGMFRVRVYRHRNAPGVWFGVCHPNVFEGVELGSKDIDEAKCQAVAKLQVILLDATKELSEAIPQGKVGLE